MFKSEERGVSPIVATVLLLAITVTVAAIVLVFVGRIGTPSQGPNVILGLELACNYSEPPAQPIDLLQLTITHNGGDTLRTAELKVLAQLVDESFVDLSENMPWPTAGKLLPGDSVTGVYDATPEEFLDPVGKSLVARVIHTPSGLTLADTELEIIYTDRSVTPAGFIVWEPVYFNSLDNYYKSPVGPLAVTAAWGMVGENWNTKRSDNIRFRVRTGAGDVTGVKFRCWAMTTGFGALHDNVPAWAPYNTSASEYIADLTLASTVGDYDYWEWTSPATAAADDENFIMWYVFRLYDPPDLDYVFCDDPGYPTNRYGVSKVMEDDTDESWMLVTSPGPWV